MARRDGQILWSAAVRDGCESLDCGVITSIRGHRAVKRDQRRRPVVTSWAAPENSRSRGHLDSQRRILRPGRASASRRGGGQVMNDSMAFLDRPAPLQGPVGRRTLARRVSPGNLAGTPAMFRGGVLLVCLGVCDATSYRSPSPLSCWPAAPPRRTRPRGTGTATGSASRRRRTTRSASSTPTSRTA